MYKQELLGQTAHISKLEADHACPHNIKKQVVFTQALYSMCHFYIKYEVLEETKLMLPDCEKRLENARNDLAKLLQFTDQTQLEPFLLEEANKLIQ